MTIKAVKSDEPYIWSTLIVDDEYIIELVFTVYGSTRVTLRNADDYFLKCNWCAGKKREDILYLVNTLLGYIEKDDTDRLPFCSWIKPYMKDEEFVRTIKQYSNTIFISDITELLLPPSLLNKTSMGVFLIDENMRSQLLELEKFAEANLFTFDDLLDIKNGDALPPGDIDGYWIMIPVGYKVVYSIELQHQKVRHLSVSSRKGVPHLEAVKQVMDILGFGPLEQCEVFFEKGKFINVMEICN